VILEQPQVDPAELARRSGWKLEPQGACKGDRCVPLPGVTVGEAIDARQLSERLGMALVQDSERGLWALGPDSGGRALSSTQMPELELPDRHGRPFSLRSLRGTRVVMIAWASW
jgi:hypothetical protein